MNVMRARMGFAMRALALKAQPVPPWQPTDLGAALKAWWNADDHGTANMTDDGAGLISSWKDRIGGCNPTATLTLRPVWASNSFNAAYAGLSFDGTDDVLRTTSYATLPTGAVSGEVWLLYDSTHTSGTTVVPFVYGGNAANNRRFVRNGNPNLNFQDGVADLGDTGTSAAGKLIVGASWLSGVSISARINGNPTTPASVAAGVQNTALGVALCIGANTPPNISNKGVYRHVLVTTTLTALQRQQLEGWLAWDTALTSLLPGGHPYKSVRP